MKARLTLHAISALVLLAVAAPALAQECTLEPPIGLRQVEVVYVPNRSDSTISVVDVTPGSQCQYQVIQTILIDTNSAPTSVFISPDGREAYVVQSSRDNVGIIDTRRGIEIGAIPIDAGNGSLAGAMSPDGTRLYVSNLLLGSISVVDLVNRVQLPSIPLGADTYPIGLRVTPDGTQLWATVEFPGSVAVIDIAGDANTIEQTIYFDPIVGPDFTPGWPPAAIDVAFDTTGAVPVATVITLGRVFLFPGIGSVALPDAFYRIPLDYDYATDGAPTPVAVGDYASPFGPGAAEIIVTPGGTTWISNSGVLDSVLSIPIPDSSGNYTNYMTVFGPGSGSPVAVLSGFDNDPSAGSGSDNLSPVGLARSQTGSAAGNQVYAVNFTSGTLAIFDGASEALEAVVPVGNGPVTPYQRRLPALPTVPEFTLTGASCGQTVNLALGDTFSFDVTASTVAVFSDEAGLTLSATGLPDPGVMTPTLPITGDDSVSSSFSWQPAAQSDVGSYVVTFDAQGQFSDAQCQVTINVTLPPPPVFSTPTNGQVFQVATGQELTFDVDVSTSLASGFVILDLLGGTSLPGSATMTPELPTDGSGASATSAFLWVPEVGDEGVYTVTWTGTDGFGQQTEHYVTIEVLEAGTEVPCEPCLVTKLHVDKRPRKGTFDYRGIFGLGDASDGIDPLTEDVTITLDGFSLTVPAGSFVKRGRYEFHFDGTVDGVRLHARLKAPRRYHLFGRSFRLGLWTWQFKGKDADLSSVDRPVETRLQIGDDYCAKTVWFARVKG